MRKEKNGQGKRLAHKSKSKKDVSSAKLAGVGLFCELYGNTLRNQVLEYILEHDTLDFAVSDVAEWFGMSRPKAYEHVYAFLSQKILKKTRILSGTQLYAINKESPLARYYVREFERLLNDALLEYLRIEKASQAKTAHRINA